MLIKTNSKCTHPGRIINTDMCMVIDVTCSEVLAEKANGKIEQLGVYETPERAKAVLEDIFTAFGNCETFTMPDENAHKTKVMFLDGVCGKCGGNAGNGGVVGEPLRCGKCGWVQPPEECESMYKEIDKMMEGLKSDN